MRSFKRFKADQGGATATIFALSVLPLLGAAGGAVDYSRAASVQSHMQRAVDATVLTLVKGSSNLSQGELDSRARQVFATTFRAGAGVTLGDVSVTRSGTDITLNAGASVETAIMKVFGIRAMPVGATASTAWVTQRIEVTLVLDNTGSMNDSIGGGQRKIDLLKSSTVKLLDELRGIATDASAVRVAIVPFDTEVRLDAPTYRNQDWFRWMTAGMRPTDWTGYVFDRFGSYASSDAAPNPAVPASMFPAPKDTGYHTDPSLMALSRGDLSAMRPLTSINTYANYQDLKTTVQNMQPRGYTNIALGVNWGFATLSPNEPFTDAAAPNDATVKKYMMVLTDGDNTAYYKDGVMRNAETSRGSAASQIRSEMDGNTATACSSTKSAGVEVFTIRLVDGNESLLKGCASPPNTLNPQHYWNAQTPDQLTQAYASFLNAITQTRLTH